MATLSLRRKIGGLREAVIAALRSRIERQSSQLPREILSKWEEANQVLTRADRLTEVARRQCEALTSDLGFLSDQVLEAAASLAAFEARGEYYRLRFGGVGLLGSEDNVKEQVESLKELGAWPIAGEIEAANEPETDNTKRVRAKDPGKQ